MKKIALFLTANSKTIVQQIIDLCEPANEILAKDFEKSIREKDGAVTNLKELIEDFKEENIWNLRLAITKYITDDFVSVTGTIKMGRQGFEFIGRLKDQENRIWFLTTQAIRAGGWNIQTLHYRYTVSLTTNDSGYSIKYNTHGVDELKKQKSEKRKQETKLMRDAENIISYINSIKWKYDNNLEYVEKYDNEIKKYQPLLNKIPEKTQELIQKMYDTGSLMWEIEDKLGVADEFSRAWYKINVGKIIEDKNIHLKNAQLIKTFYDRYYNHNGTPKYSKEDISDFILENNQIVSQIKKDYKKVGQIN